MAEETMEERMQRVEKMARRALDVQEIQNVMSKHAFYDAAGANHDQLRDIWAQTVPDVSFGQNHGMYVGMESIVKCYGDFWEKKTRPERLEMITELFPELAKEKKNDLAGWMKMHTNTAPCIEVAGDGKTAKGTWESPGFITEIVHGKLQALWIWERYAVDFLKENGRWKLWHFNAYVQFATPYEKSWVTSALEPDIGMPFGPEAQNPPDKVIIRNLDYNPKKLVGPLTPDFPRQPEPYETFSETFSYGP